MGSAASGSLNPNPHEAYTLALSAVLRNGGGDGSPSHLALPFFLPRLHGIPNPLSVADPNRTATQERGFQYGNNDSWSTLQSFSGSSSGTLAELVASTSSRSDAGAASTLPPGAESPAATLHNQDGGDANGRPLAHPRHRRSRRPRSAVSTLQRKARLSRSRNGCNIGTGLGDDVAMLDEQTIVRLAALMKPYCCACAKANVFLAAQKLPSSQSVSTPSSPTLADELRGMDFRAPPVVGDLSALTPLLEPLLSVPFSRSSSLEASPSLSAVTWVPSMYACFEEGLLYRVEWRREAAGDVCRTTEAAEDDAIVFWCFFNSSPHYKMEIEVALEVPAGRAVEPISALGSTQLEWTATSEENVCAPWRRRRHPVARSTCPPLTCLPFIKGTVKSYHTTIRAEPVPSGLLPEAFLPSSSVTTPVWRTRLEAELWQVTSLAGAATSATVRRRFGEDRHTELCLSACVAANVPFVDAHFFAGEGVLGGPSRSTRGTSPTCGGGQSPAPPPENESAGALVFPIDATVTWARITEVIHRVYGDGAEAANLRSALEPRIFFLPLSPVLIGAGQLGDSWVVGAMAAVAEHSHLLVRMFRHPVSPMLGAVEQRLGAYRVTLNWKGWWCSVIVDDYFPATNGSYLQCAHSRRDVREMWVPLLEKAYAKVQGGYARIVAGDPIKALQDFTGWPCGRYDLSPFNDLAAVSEGFASRLARYNQHGFQVVLYTAVRSNPATPALRAEADVTQRYMSPLAGALHDAPSAANGLTAGSVYSVLRIQQLRHQQSRSSLILVQIRSLWGDVRSWKGKWCCGSPRWMEEPQVAAACFMQDCVCTRSTGADGSFPSPEPNGTLVGDLQGNDAPCATAAASGAHRVCACQREQYIWMEWSEVCQHFSGCGVVFRLPLFYDYRVRGVFEGGCPSVCLRITVAVRTFVGAMLSMCDREDDASADATASAQAGDCPPIMLSLAKEEGSQLRVTQNSQLDPDNPTARFIFMQTSSASLLSFLTPEESPYWLIPRMLVRQPPAEAAVSGAHPSSPSHPYVLSFFQKERAGEAGFRVDFCRLPSYSPAFRNCASFRVDNPVEMVSTAFQARAPHAAFPATYTHTEIAETAAIPLDKFRRSFA